MFYFRLDSYIGFNVVRIIYMRKVFNEKVNSRI